MKLIILSGEADSGKTGIMTQIINNKNVNIVTLIKQTKPRQKGNLPDYIGVFIIKNKRVGIVTRGDNRRQIIEGCSLLLQSNYKFDVIICVCHLSNVNYTINLYQQNNAHVVVTNRIKTNLIKSNTTRIVNTINSII